jgi:iron complex transport system ATP-binding protein
MIELKNLSKTLGRQTIVKEASTQFVPGFVTSIIGPNGAGKSSLLAMVNRSMNPDSGDVVIDQKALVEWDVKSLAKSLSMLRQANDVTMRFTVRELVSFGRFPHSRGKLTHDDQVVIDRAIDYLALKPIENKYLDQLSGGQRQLAFIAMVIAQDTQYIFLDEPLNNLDIKHSIQIMKTIQNLAHDLGKAVVVVIHDINFASSYSDYIVAMKLGEIVAAGKTQDVIREEILASIYETPFRIIDVDGHRMCAYHH